MRQEAHDVWFVFLFVRLADVDVEYLVLTNKDSSSMMSTSCPDKLKRCHISVLLINGLKIPLNCLEDF